MNGGEAQVPHGTGTPSDWVVQYASQIPVTLKNSQKSGESVLDLACGKGRHTRYLLSLGHRVTAVDRDTEGLRDRSDHPALEIIEADLEASGGWPLGNRQFTGVVVTNYLWRPLLPQIVEAVAPGGVLIYETFGQGNERFGRPRNPDFLLRPGELEEAVAAKMTVVAYAHEERSTPRPAVVQHICARRDDRSEF
jgi:SAM-dependent methyltransferase